ncbi:MAG: hypothetical protein GX259_08710 [Bacteroidales bacterium]|nr:hypothetical protein [Bacteroidales bacterium]
MKQIFRYNKYKILLLIILVLVFSACDVLKYIGGDKRWIKRDLGLSGTTDSYIIPQNKSYYNEMIFKNKTGAYYSFDYDSICTNFIVWDNGWYTIVIYDSREKQDFYYSYDKRNRLRMLVRFSKHCNCYVSKIEFNKRGKIIYLQNQGVAF